MKRLFIANRGEIAARIARAARDLSITAVVPYVDGDRDSLASTLADESVYVGHGRSGVAAYLDTESIVRAATSLDCDAVHPGYGFLSESPELARACAEAGVTFVGPSPAVLEVTGDKVRARQVAQGAGLPVPRATGLLRGPDDALAGVAEVGGFPLFVKASRGGGGRGLRLVSDVGEFTDALQAAQREANAVFGYADVYLEEAVRTPRHIEVQILGDASGGVVHLGDRDCSIQRRHQKLVEMAPAPHLAEDVRRRLHDGALSLARELGYQGAGTVEFLVDPEGAHRFIEVNPRLQVEHTVTEEVTGVDLVLTQLQLAQGRSLDELRLTPSPPMRGAAIQLRVIAEDPGRDFRPVVGTMIGARLPAGPGVRIDGVEVGAGIRVSPEFDSLLLKLVVDGPDLGLTVRRARRALDELSLPGIATNLAFLRAVLDHPDLATRPLTTSFLSDHPEFAIPDPPALAGTLMWVAERTVQYLATPMPPTSIPRDPEVSGPDRPGSRALLAALGPQGFADRVRTDPRPQLTDTTLRDAHQSLLATRLRTVDLVEGARRSDRHLRGVFSLEAWGGATHDAALRFGLENPWERLERLREGAPETCLQMLLRGRNIVAYGSVSDRTLEAFVREAVHTGVDVFRIFDALNNVDRMDAAIRMVADEGAVAEGTLCYTGSLLDPAERVYTLDHYLAVAEGLVDAGCHVLAVKDMAGVMTPDAATILVTALRSRFGVPVHLHTHDTSGGQLATCLAAIAAGVDIVDAASAPMAGGTSQPSMAALVDALQHTSKAPVIELEQVRRLEPFWAAMRRRYAIFDAGQPPPDGLVRQHQMPGGQITNLRHQASALGLDLDHQQLAEAYSASNRVLGNPIKVTPTSKVVGDLALYLLMSGIDADELQRTPSAHDLPASVIDFLRGDLGVPPGGWPEPLRTRVLESVDSVDRETVEVEIGPAMSHRQAQDQLDAILLPEAARCRQEALARYGDLTDLPTDVFLRGLVHGQPVRWESRGRQQHLELVATADVGDDVEVVVRTREGICCVRVPNPDRASVPTPTAQRDEALAVTDDDVTTPVPGVVSVLVSDGDRVTAGSIVAVVEAMKLETSLRAPHDGTVLSTWVGTGATVQAGAPIVRVTPVATGNPDAVSAPPAVAR